MRNLVGNVIGVATDCCGILQVVRGARIIYIYKDTSMASGTTSFRHALAFVFPRSSLYDSQGTIAAPLTTLVQRSTRQLPRKVLRGVYYLVWTTARESGFVNAMLPRPCTHTRKSTLGGNIYTPESGNILIFLFHIDVRTMPHRVTACPLGHTCVFACLRMRACVCECLLVTFRPLLYRPHAPGITFSRAGK